jgi:hypothetical protein
VRHKHADREEYVRITNDGTGAQDTMNREIQSEVGATRVSQAAPKHDSPSGT